MSCTQTSTLDIKCFLDIDLADSGTGELHVGLGDGHPQCVYAAGGVRDDLHFFRLSLESDVGRAAKFEIKGIEGPLDF